MGRADAGTDDTTDCVHDGFMHHAILQRPNFGSGEAILGRTDLLGHIGYSPTASAPHAAH